MRLLTEIFVWDTALAERLASGLRDIGDITLTVSDDAGLRAVRAESGVGERERVSATVERIAPDALVNRRFVFDSGDYEHAQLLRVTYAQARGADRVIRVTDDGWDVLLADRGKQSLLRIGATESEFVEFGRWWRIQPRIALPPLGAGTTGVIREDATTESDGHFESLEEAVQLAYDPRTLPAVLPPLMRTWEQFGIARGASPLILVSREAFEAVTADGAERCDFVPVMISPPRHAA